MRKIDYYIDRVKSEDIYGGDERTKAYPFLEDGVILVKKPEKYFVELKARIRKCKSLGINIPEYFEYKSTSDYRHWILEELAPGEQFGKLVNNDNGQNIISKIPYEHIEKYIRDSYLLSINGIGVEPRRRNIFYDTEKGFTTIDVAVLQDCNIVKNDSLKSVLHFFLMFSNVLLVKFSKDDRGQIIEQKTVLNMCKAFENAHPFFKKYSRFLYRHNSSYARILSTSGYDLTLNDDEYDQFISLIDEFVSSEIKKIVKNPENLFIDYNILSLLSSSIKYCPQFSLFDIKSETEKMEFNVEHNALENYVKSRVFDGIKVLFLNNIDDDDLKKAYYCIRKKELDPVGIYQDDYIENLIDEELKNEKVKQSK